MTLISKLYQTKLALNFIFIALSLQYLVSSFLISLQYPQTCDVLGMTGDPVLPLDLVLVELGSVGVVAGPKEGGVVSVGRGVHLGTDWQQFLQLGLETMIEARNHGRASREEDGSGHFLPGVKTALGNCLLDENMDSCLIQAPKFRLEDALRNLKSINTDSYWT